MLAVSGAMRGVLIFACLAACHTPGPHFRGLPATRIVVDGSSFDVRVRDDVAEAIRTNVEYAPRFGPIADRAQHAIEQVSGCRVREMRGDQAQSIGLLDCKGQRPRAVPGLPKTGDQECLVTGEFKRESTGETVLEMDCAAIR